MITAEEIIGVLKLRPLPVEGGLYRQTYVASEEIGAEALAIRYGRTKSLCTAIYYLLTDQPQSFSALHRLPTDEVYHFYLGDPVEMLLLHPEGRSEVIVLGQDLLAGQHVQHVVPAGVWMGSRVFEGGQFALLGTTMAPGYDDLDYEGGNAEELERQYPEWASLIRQLSR
ncbi:MAG: cupin domain-containing protein [Chloroflexi bacterium]|nr:cupin domain-containing protein [Chloroflexota bacterium]MCI0773964.1 cupin domain-containing protein [Chloroflexota bacterium]MCI0807111.1 cupin domain-containing protein [Chloroflexota bacterium]MCI0827888.1 cupin domain-containing protein [Chloroflexota bacterium]MCI0854730.1 cupin domain-containing protein [Chloroflexota bacterium]